LELAHVGCEWDFGEVSAQDALRRGVDLAEELRSVSCVVEANLNAADASEQSDDGKLLSNREPWMLYARGHRTILWSSDDITNIRS
jgi:hypothetical protein